jgi:hypothetical protein
MLAYAGAFGNFQRGGWQKLYYRNADDYGVFLFVSTTPCGALRDTIKDFEIHEKRILFWKLRVYGKNLAQAHLVCGLALLIVLGLMLALGSFAVVQLALPLLFGVAAVTYSALFVTLPLRYQLMGKKQKAPRRNDCVPDDISLSPAARGKALVIKGGECLGLNRILRN